MKLCSSDNHYTQQLYNIRTHTQQPSFRNSHSANLALMNLTQQMREALDKIKSACGSFLDLQ